MIRHLDSTDMNHGHGYGPNGGYGDQSAYVNYRTWRMRLDLGIERITELLG